MRHGLLRGRRLPGATEQRRRERRDLEDEPRPRSVEHVGVEALQRVGAAVDAECEVAPVADPEQIEHGAPPAGLVAERRVEHQHPARAQGGDGVDGRHGDVRWVRVPARAPRAKQARRRVVRAAAAEEEAELRQPLDRVRVRRVVGQVLRVERQRRALERVAAAGLAVTGLHLRRQHVSTADSASPAMSQSKGAPGSLKSSGRTET